MLSHVPGLQTYNSKQPFSLVNGVAVQIYRQASKLTTSPGSLRLHIEITCDYITLQIYMRQVKAAGGTLRKVCLRQHVLTLRCPSGGFSLRQKRKGYLFFNLAASRLSRSASWDFSRACSSRAALLRTSRSYFSTSIRIESIRR